MTLIHARQGLDLRVSGGAGHQVVAAPAPSQVAVMPDRIPFIKPRLKVRTGDTVRIGSPLFFDKRMPDLVYRSPGAGTVSDIRFGPRRVVTHIVIDLDGAEDAEPLPGAAVGPGGDRGQIVAALVAGGLWPLIRALPYRDVAPVNGPPPPALIVSMSNREPFQLQPSVYLRGHETLFMRGLDALRRLSPRVMVTVDDDDKEAIGMLGDAVTHRHRGAYPAGDPGVTLYLTRTSAADNRAWFIRGQDVLLVAELLERGVYPTTRLVTVDGPGSDRRTVYRTRIGAPLSPFIPPPADPAVRIICGGLFTGRKVTADDFLGLFDSAVTLVPEGIPEEFLALVDPGLKRPSYSRAFLSALSGGDVRVDCNFHGELRACVACSYCNRVCPVALMPQLTFKSLLADEIEEALANGLLDCVECGLCSYVCPSKIDICDILVQGKRGYYKEQQR